VQHEKKVITSDDNPPVNGVRVKLWTAFFKGPTVDTGTAFLAASRQILKISFQFFKF
jgi:hypothetical protein